MKRLWPVLLAVCGLSATSALAEKLSGNIWDVDPLIVDGVEVTATSATRVERRGQPGIGPNDLRIGWEVEVEGKPMGEDQWVATRIRVRSGRDERTGVRGFVERLHPGGFDAGGERVRLGRLSGDGVRPGRYVEGRGRRLDDGSVELETLEIIDRPLDRGKTKFLARALLEREELESHLSFDEDRLMEDYVASIGERLVPDWVDPAALRFELRVVDDPEIVLFAFPDGALFVSSGLLAALDDEAQLAAVLAHAIVHIVHEHTYLSDEPPDARWRSLGAVVSASSVDVRTSVWEGPAWAAPLVEIGATASLDAAMSGYGRALEDAADRIALGYLVDAGYDPFEAPRAWELLSRYAAARAAPPAWFLGRPSTHRARVASLTPLLNRDYRGARIHETRSSNEEVYGASLASLRRLNAAMDGAAGEYRAAEAMLRRVLARDAGDALAHLYLGKLLWEIGGAEAADESLGELRLATELAPALAEPYREMGHVYDVLGYRDSAASAYARYLEMAPSAADAAEIEARAEALR